jgi:hypothetical protein
MNERLQKDLSTLENMIGIQTDCVIAGDPSVQYMHGMLNGLICAHSIFADSHDPDFYIRPIRKKHAKIRHKSNKRII